MPLDPVSMLWNWYTVDTCFLSASWHNNTKAKFAGSVLGVFLLTIAIEFVRRLGREYDKRLIEMAKVRFSVSQTQFRNVKASCSAHGA